MPVSPLGARLALEVLGNDRFVGGPVRGQRHLFGGLVVAQALAAAQSTVRPEQPAHSVHASFLRAGRGDEPLDHDVERTRDGSSFATRRVVVRQQGEPVLVLVGSFQVPERGPVYQPPDAMPAVPGPEGLPPGRYDGEVFDCRDVPAAAAGPPHARRMWFRARGEVGDDPAQHRLGLVYATDHGPTRAAREPHAAHPGVERRMSVSLDHAVWLHADTRVDRWLLSELVPRVTGAARGLTVGSVWTAAGELVATIAQEVLLRLPDGEETER